MERIENLLSREGISFTKTKVIRDGVEKEVLAVGEGACKLAIYENTFNGSETDDEIMKFVHSYLEGKPELATVEEWVSWDYAKDNVRISLRPRSTIDDDRYAKRIINDNLEAIYRIFIPEGTIAVPHNLLEKWKISENELYLAALMNVNNMTTSMSLDSMLGFEDEESPDMGIPMIIFSNTEMNFGGASILNTKKLEEIAQKYEDDLYIIPSSVHECIVTPAAKNDYHTIKSMIEEVNETNLKPEDVLANYPFYYERGSDKVNFEPKSA